MRCPFCNVDNDKVVDSRSSSDGGVVRRRRECLACSKRFTTYERIEETPLRVVKKDGSRAPFDREKIRHGIQRACEKRPVSAAQIDEVVAEIDNEISRKYDREVPTRVIGEMVMEGLKRLDKVAYVRFASVYREFKDLEDFVAAVKGA
ncbi:MAG: transcriptional repressor NrdR [Planctomycetes bacterium]|nr:transcriptional repressor NrdR [Planctomycetota bacterium]